MNRVVTYPDGSSLTSTALNKIEMEGAWQDVLAASIGIDLSNPNVYALVRAGWQTQGQPAFEVVDDIVFVRCEPLDSPYSRLRDAKFVQNASQGWGEQPYGISAYGGYELSQSIIDVHTRSWRACISVYGPNSIDNARAIVSSMLDVSYIDSLLASNNLYVNPDIEQPLRIPEVFQGQWWERVDVVIEFNEEITETFTVGTVGTVVVTTYDKDGQLTTQTITV